MKKLLALMIALVMVMGLAGFALAFEVHHPAKKDRDGSIAKNGKSIGIAWVNAIAMEGSTSNANHTVLSATDPTAINRVLLPDSSGTVALADDIASTMALGNATMLVGNIGDLAVPVAHELTGDVTGTMGNTGGLVTVIGSNKVGTNESNLNTVTLNIPGGDTTATVEVETGSTFMGWYIGNYGAINSLTFANAPLWVDPDVTVTINGPDASQQTTFKFTFLRP